VRTVGEYCVRVSARVGGFVGAAHGQCAVFSHRDKSSSWGFLVVCMGNEEWRLAWALIGDR